MWLNRVDVWIYKGLRGVDVDVVIVWYIMGYYGILWDVIVFIHLFAYFGCEDLRGLCLLWNA